MERFELVEILDDVRLAKSGASGIASLALGMHCLERDDAWHVLYGAASDAAERLFSAETKLKRLLEEG